MPFAVVIGEDEVAQGKVKIKEMGLREGHPEKEGVLVDLSDLVDEVRKRLQRKRELDDMTRQAEGLRVVHGIKNDESPAHATADGEAVNPVAATTTSTEPANASVPS